MFRTAAGQSRPALGGNRKARIAFYSHDTMGLGHIRRNLLIAQTLSESDLDLDILLVTGSRETGRFLIPPGVDCLVLPSLYKEPDGGYRSRHLSLSLEDLIELRRSALFATITAFQPDVLIVDNVSEGASRELDTTLAYLRAEGHTRCVLGHRDVRDSATAVRADGLHERFEQTVRRYYDQIWIYGDAAVYDAAREYGYAPDVAGKVRYSGYLDQRKRLQPSRNAVGHPTTRQALGLPPGRFALCMVGSGQDGEDLAEAFAHAELPPGLNGVLVTGPHMHPDTQHRLRLRASTSDRLSVLEFVPEPTALLADADCVIGMGGYNTATEILSFGKRALIVPRVAPREEQLIRATRLGQLGLTDMLHPDELSSAALTQWLENTASQPRHDVSHTVDLGGLERLPGYLAELLADSPSTPLPVNLNGILENVRT